MGTLVVDKRVWRKLHHAEHWYSNLSFNRPGVENKGGLGKALRTKNNRGLENLLARTPELQNEPQVPSRFLSGRREINRPECGRIIPRPRLQVNRTTTGHSLPRLPQLW